MARRPRVVVPGVPHHVTQQGNRKEDVFFSDEGRWKYLDLLAEYSAKHGLQIMAYCLMTNHLHLIVVPSTAESLGNALRSVDMRYTQYVNWSEGLTGVLWRNRPYSCPLDDRHFWAAVRYVERNPVRAGLAVRAEEYPWSSAAVHCGLRTSATLAPLPPHPDIVDWPDFLSDPDEERMLKAIRFGTRRGVPMGDDAFMASVEKALNRLVRPAPRGRRWRHSEGK